MKHILPGTPETKLRKFVPARYLDSKCHSSAAQSSASRIQPYPDTIRRDGRNHRCPRSACLIVSYKGYRAV